MKKLALAAFAPDDPVYLAFDIIKIHPPAHDLDGDPMDRFRRSFEGG